MSVVACPSCSKQLQYTPQLAGKQVRCPACQAAMILPGATNPSPPAHQAVQPATAPSQPVIPASGQQTDPFPGQTFDPLAPTNQQSRPQTPAAYSQASPQGNTDPLVDPAAMASIPSPQVPVQHANMQPYQVSGQAYQAPAQPYQSTGQPYQPAGPAAQASVESPKLTEKQQLDFVNKGVQLVFWGNVTMIAAGLMMAILPIIFPFAFPILGMAYLGGLIAILVGYVFSLHAPKESNSRKFIIIALSAIGLSTGLTLFATVAIFLGFLILGISLFLFALLPSLFAGIGSVVLYLFFLKTLADYTKQPQAAEEAQRLAIQLLIIIGVGFVLSILFSLMPPQPRMVIGTIASLGFFVAEIFWLVSFLQFLESLEFRKRKKRKIGTSTGGGWGARR